MMRKKLLLVALIALITFTFIPIIHVTYQEEETYMRPEKYLETIPVEVTIDVPYTIEKRTEWDVTWGTIGDDLRWGSVVGTSTFPAAFEYDWGTGRVFSDYSKNIGFTAEATISMGQVPVSFIVGSSNNVELFFDEDLILDITSDGKYVEKTVTIEIPVIELKTHGPLHTLRLKYYKLSEPGKITFTTDVDVFSWEEKEYRRETVTQQKQVEKERMVPDTRVITKNKFISLAEYLLT